VLLEIRGLAVAKPKDSSVEQMAGNTMRLPLDSDCDDNELSTGIACLLAATRDLNAATDFRRGLERVAERLERYVDYDTFAVLLLDDHGRELSFEFAVGFPQDVLEHWKFGLGQGIVGIAAQSGESLLVQDTSGDSRYIHATDRVRSELALPLVTKRRTIGVLDLGSYEPNNFTPEQQRLLASLADHLASAVENAQLYQNMRQQARTLSLLHEVSREMASILDRGMLLERVAELVRPLIDYDIFSVMLWNENERLLVPKVALFGEDVGNRDTAPMPLGQGICGTAAALRQSIRVPNVEVDPRYVSCVEDLAVRSELAVPLFFKERLIGVIDLQSLRYDSFSAHHEQLLSTLASSLAIALENARLYEELQDDEARLESDLNAAREIQRQLLPKQSPWMPGVQMAVAYEAARHLAGDFYDFLPYGDEKIALAVADVSGKGTSAALYGSLAIGTIREYARRSRPSPAEMQTELNNKLRQLSIDNRFLAMTFGVLDGSDRSLTLSNSGLPRPYLLQGRSARQLETTGVPLGLMADQAYEEIKLELGPGEAVVICSDGIEESPDSHDEEFGQKRIEDTLKRLAHLPAEEIADGLLEAVRRYSPADEPSDDRTVFVLKVV
jgi:sigma-B regulation protein RsbU (phosphoserine phosphatase)